ncbi:F-box/FBD/LRR-repeat protein [Carex littledalei]|uniref:F-box/FBD/LRR-repeat protein n=1 Tax=Carex littledalei TaxID=544730 RepID=A0A833QYS5_9POAL|nr:F-box/FBD/LRR-repeat protein [Carex littledalei]
MPPSIFLCHDLDHLEVANCFINAPQPFQYPMLLRTLKLSHFILIGNTLENLVSNLPLLESLDLSQFAVDRLVICSPGLRRLNIVGRFAAISLETPKIISASIFFNGIPDLMNGGETNNSKFLAELSNIEELEILILSMFSVYLVSGPIPKKLQSTYNFLKKIVICMYGRRKARVIKKLLNLPKLSGEGVILSDLSCSN